MTNTDYFGRPFSYYEGFTFLAFIKDLKLFVIGDSEGETFIVTKALVRSLAKRVHWIRPIRAIDAPAIALLGDGYELVQKQLLGYGDHRISCAFAPKNRRWIIWRGNESRED